MILLRPAAAAALSVKVAEEISRMTSTLQVMTFLAVSSIDDEVVRIVVSPVFFATVFVLVVASATAVIVAVVLGVPSFVIAPEPIQLMALVSAETAA